MALELRPGRGGFLRPFGCGWFIREYLMGNGPEGSTPIDPERGAPQADINFEYKESLARATARERAEKIISRMVLKGDDVTEEQAERIHERELKKISRKFTRMRYHSFLVYFGVLKRLGWVEATSETEGSSIQDNYPDAPDRAYYRLTRAGREAGEDLWSNPQYALYPENGRSHQSKETGWPHRKARSSGN
jgi:DNA-binding PadR family transcriptional regulator